MSAQTDIRGERVLVVGLGKSGLAAARLLHAKGATVLVNDARTEVLGLDALPAAIERVLGGHPEDVFTSVDRIVVSPGVPSLPALEAAEAAGIPVASEIELASWFIDAPIIAVTGTNGKSTVVSMLGCILDQLDRPSFVGGNLGTPLTEVVGSAAASTKGIVALELSSYQLERVEHFAPEVGVLLNITEDHLNRYSSFEEYANAKGNLFLIQSENSFAIYPEGDSLCKRYASKSRGEKVAFSSARMRVSDGILQGGGISLPMSELHVRGLHNELNLAAAALAAQCAGIPNEAIEAGLRNFRGLPHRVEFVRNLDGVQYFDDSKATNVGAAVAALDGFAAAGEKVILIAGGRDKDGSYAPLREALGLCGRALVTLGEGAARIEDELASLSLPGARASDMREAVNLARRFANSGDIVLLAPACSSFDMYRSYAERGDVFQAEVRGLDGEVTR